MNWTMFGHILKHPMTVLGGAALGLVVGVQYPQFAAAIGPFGAIFLAMLQMVALPIILFAVISGLGSMLYSGLVGSSLRRFAVLLVAGPLCAAGLGLAGALLVQPGEHLPAGAESIFGRMLADSPHAAALQASGAGFWHFAKQVVPQNIFVSLVDGHSLQVLFFAILVGVALGLERKKGNETTLVVVESLFDALLKIINWLIYLLPFGLFALLASQAGHINMTGLLAMVRLVLVFAGTCLLLFLICNLLIARRTRSGYVAVLAALRETILVALGSSSAFAALPSALRGLQGALKLDRRITDLMTPLALNLLPLASIIYFTVASVFIAQISGVELTLANYVTLFFGSIFAGLAAASLPSAAGVAVIGIVLRPLGLPVEVAVVLLIAIDPILDPIVAAVDTYVACTVAALVADRPEGAEALQAGPRDTTLPEEVA